jgi:hypothetical protein
MVAENFILIERMFSILKKIVTYKIRLKEKWVKKLKEEFK